MGEDGRIRLAAGAASVSIDVDAGGRLASLVIGGRERLLAGSGEDDRSIRWGSFLMAPWVGRMSDATLDWEGRRHRFRANEGPHSLHGLLFDRAWSVVDRDSTGARLEIDLGAAGWPFGGTVRQAVRLHPDRIELAAAIQAHAAAMPAAMGWHPWFVRAEREDVALCVVADEVLETRPDLIPTGRRLPVGDETDLRGGPVLGARRLDHAYVDVHSPAVVAWPDLVLTIAFAPPVQSVVVYTPQGSVCVEPQTSWPDAATLCGRGVRGTGLVRLEPGETLSASTTWAWSATAGGDSRT
jgi:aldose 1-epimerase